MKKQESDAIDWPGQTRDATIRLAKWTILWVLTVAIPAFGPALFWGENHLINSLAILLNVGVGIGMIMASINHLKMQDEMMQKVQLEAMGFSLGVGVVAGIAFTMLDTTNVIPFDAEISYLVMIIAITYLVSVFINLRRYK
ncbi:hypothetical protein DYD21_01200 [Rhodohalobacter sp. SW132]|uniref:hypothetical protein n=1 Tax=Rhodohalobacter sp. SW132 TaxID=2293433 RepID=UPI000E25B091|nr:hypothetical protein [Rhodohalobacter sp. SW132]REL38595.1 hypothetical protein DYD21_01200 [Rhodohalobacter sp. SW132]